jgi:tungstate transport system substrate-binding protein
MSIWKTADVDPKGKKWYLEVGQGMGKALRIANEKRAYTLTDRGTWLALKDRERLDMMIVVEGDRMFFNQYGVMIVNPAKHSHVKYDSAMKFVEFLVSQKGQNAIASFKDSKGNQLFYPNARSN